MADNPQMVITEEAQTAGALVFWSLSGTVDIDDLQEVARATKFDTTLLPKRPSLELIAQRAAQDVLAQRRQLLRPLERRGAWAIVQERYVSGQLNYEELVRVHVDKEHGEIVITPCNGQEELAVCVQDKVKWFRCVLTTVDVSNWFLVLLSRHIQAVGLRERGGFYFVPRDRLDLWRSVVSLTRACSGHQIYEIPAMRTEEAVSAILASVRREAKQTMEEMETYLTESDKVTNKGLNAWERKLEALQSKVAHYAELLGASLPDIQDKAVVLLGGLNAARLKK